MASKFNDKTERRKVISGFPIDEKFLTPESLEEYFQGDSIVCLRCGKIYKTLGNHLKMIHGMGIEEYKEIYGIPWTYGLACSFTSEKYAELAKKRLEDGTLTKLTKEQMELGKIASSKQRKRQPVRLELTRRNLDKMNESKTGEESARRKLMAKKGTKEFKEKMKARPQSEATKEMLRTYWVGREQTDDHVFNRTGGKKKAK
jgi:hypothetical protein